MTTLPRRALGRTGLEVTSLSYGAMELRGTPAGPEVSDEQAERVLMPPWTPASTSSTPRRTTAAVRNGSVRPSPGGAPSTSWPQSAAASLGWG